MLYSAACLITVVPSHTSALAPRPNPHQILQSLEALGACTPVPPVRSHTGIAHCWRLMQSLDLQWESYRLGSIGSSSWYYFADLVLDCSPPASPTPNLGLVTPSMTLGTMLVRRLPTYLSTPAGGLSLPRRGILGVWGQAYGTFHRLKCIPGSRHKEHHPEAKVPLSP